MKFLIQYIAPSSFCLPFLYRCPHAYDACEGTRHTYNGGSPFGAHALHVMHDNHLANLSSHV